MFKYVFSARDKTRGENAVKELENEGLKPKFHLLDISSVDSIKTLASFLKEKYGGLDVLVNNAAIAYKVISYVVNNLSVCISYVCKYSHTTLI